MLAFHKPAALAATLLTLPACVSTGPGSVAPSTEIARSPEARGIQGVNPRATAILQRIAAEDDDRD